MLHLVFVTNSHRSDASEWQWAGSGTDPLSLDPLSPRSIVLSLLLGSHPPRMRVGRILEFTSLFDLAPGTVRTALSRMVAAGELANDDGSYRLIGRLVERQAQQDAGRADPRSEWDGTWWTVAVLSERRTMAERRAFRARAVGARLGELRPDLWLRPANVALTTELSDAVVTQGPIVVGDGYELAAQLWDLDRLDAERLAHTDSIAIAAQRLADDVGDQALADAFVRLAATQQYLRTEPQLPVELAPGASAATVRVGYRTAVGRFQERLAQFFARGDPERISTDVR